MSTAVKSEFMIGIKETVNEVAADVRSTKQMVNELRAEYDTKLNLDQYLQKEEERQRKEQEALAQAEEEAKLSLQVGEIDVETPVKKEEEEIK